MNLKIDVDYRRSKLHVPPLNLYVTINDILKCRISYTATKARKNQTSYTYRANEIYVDGTDRSDVKICDITDLAIDIERKKQWILEMAVRDLTPRDYMDKESHM